MSARLRRQVTAEVRASRGQRLGIEPAGNAEAAPQTAAVESIWWSSRNRLSCKALIRSVPRPWYAHKAWYPMDAVSPWIEEMSESASLRYVDLFCGAGGLALGFSEEGFSCTWAGDSWAAAVDTYDANIGSHVRQVEIADDLDIPWADVYVGGPPCQGFSSAGLRRDGDDRNTLVRVFAALVAKNRPRAFVFENVEGFLTGARGRFVVDLLEPVVRAGYRVHLRKVNAANYGAPQHRKRVVAIGGLGWDPAFPAPTHSAHGAPGSRLAAKSLPLAPTVAQALDGLRKPSDGGSPRDDHVSRRLRPLDVERIQLLQPGQTMRDLPEELWHDSYKRRANRRVMDGTPSERRGGAPAGLRRLRADQPSKAITAAASAEFVHPTENRLLTLRECARIQTFPDWFFFQGSRSDRATLTGNAVPPVLARAIASSLADSLRSAQSTHERGTLLSFVPTLSMGKSPALQSVCDLVARTVQQADAEAEQMALWP